MTQSKSLVHSYNVSMYSRGIQLRGTSKNLLRHPIAASRARSRLAYLLDISRCSLNAKLAQARGSLHSNVLVTVFRGAHVLPACLNGLGLLAFGKPILASLVYKPVGAAILHQARGGRGVLGLA